MAWKKIIYVYLVHSINFWLSRNIKLIKTHLIKQLSFSDYRKSFLNDINSIFAPSGAK